MKRFSAAAAIILTGLACFAKSAELPESSGFEISFKADFGQGRDIGLIMFSGENAPAFSSTKPAAENALGIGFQCEEKDDRQKRSSIFLTSSGLILENRPSPLKFDRTREFEIKLTPVCGGRNITLSIDGKKHSFYTDYFLPDAVYPLSRLKFSEKAVIRDFAVKKTGRGFHNSKPAEVSWKGSGYWNRSSKTLRLPKSLEGIGRVTLDWKLIPKDDPWDRVNRLFSEQAGKSFEIARIITSYNEAGGRWKQDITPLAKLLTGERKLKMQVDGNFGWQITLRYYKGEGREIPRKIVPLWNGKFRYGPPGVKGLEGIEPKEVKLPDWAERAEFFSIFTGHGWKGNKGRGAEFIRKWRKLSAGGKEFMSYLWEDESEFNPIDHQGGTWHIDRAGWRPGCLVRPWIVDVPAEAGKTLKLDYTAEPYSANFKKDSQGRGYHAQHFAASCLLVYD
ncbi:hypothetical protein L21SP3_01966 [Sedimentisphaera cyanobacteriorum]|uniref:Peptide-N-glycosidase F C-terminal domain-containing protein n=1 Tax=Sedimentisphaera cyanobacteriorum TaxID=1940790 RepID=A0A1Q2HRW6_9BACT|nr:peptide-N-glycosidase F-related protein [Sedimentisphaera cyanobacteriorum]AQQ10140.1 hypothetical protein L21SP3_01966 [Sedimentisphaera cyanobacteriorum]